MAMPMYYCKACRGLEGTLTNKMAAFGRKHISSLTTMPMQPYHEWVFGAVCEAAVSLAHISNNDGTSFMVNEVYEVS